MTGKSSRELRRAQQRANRSRKRRPQPPGRATLAGIPVYDGVVVQIASGESNGQRDDRVVVGIGPEGEDPVAYALLCPCEGVRGLVKDLEAVGAVASEHHPLHL